MAVSMDKYQNWVNYLLGNVASNTISWKQTGGDAIKVVLSNTAPTLTLDKYTSAGITELATGAGYTNGGAACTQSDKSYATGTLSFPLTCGSPTWTSTTSDMGPFQYVIFYDSTPTDKPLIGSYNYASALTLHGANSDTFTVSLTGNNLFSIT